MKSQITITAILLAGIFLAATSCSDFLDTQQRGVTTQDNFYKTDEEATEALYAIYNKVQGDELNFFQMKNLLSDDATAAGGGRGDNAQGEELDEYRFGPSNSIIRANFTRYYQIAYTANILIDRVQPETDVKKMAIAEAKAFRAFAYFELVTLWGPVPLVTRPLNPDEYAQPNGKIDEIWAQIESDLREAIADLPWKSQLSAARKGNVSKGTAYAWLGKALLFQKKYAEAASELDKLIESNEYGLNPDFATITRKSSEFNEESLFEISYADELSTITEGNRIVAYCGPRTPYFKAGTSGVTETGWGWVSPRMSLHDAFTAAGEEVRRRGTIMSEKELIEDFGGSFRNAEGHLPYGSDGSVRIKHGAFVDETPGEEYHTISGMNFRITRYAEVLLMAAEAHNRKSGADDAKALGYVNQVRARAEMPNLTVAGDQLFEAIKQERRFELAFEFVRYQDLIRWGDAAKALADKGKKIPRGDGSFFEFPDAGFKDRHQLLPFPEAEMNVNPNLEQNPGW